MSAAHSALSRRILAAINATPGAWAFNHAAGAASEAGIPDIIGCYRGTFLGIEVKTGTGRVSKIQKHKLDLIAAAGGVAIVARTLDDVLLALQSIPRQ